MYIDSIPSPDPLPSLSSKLWKRIWANGWNSLPTNKKKKTKKLEGESGGELKENRRERGKLKRGGEEKGKEIKDGCYHDHLQVCPRPNHSQSQLRIGFGSPYW